MSGILNRLTNASYETSWNEVFEASADTQPWNSLPDLRVHFDEASPLIKLAALLRWVNPGRLRRRRRRVNFSGHRRGWLDSRNGQGYSLLNLYESWA